MAPGAAPSTSRRRPAACARSSAGVYTCPDSVVSCSAWRTPALSRSGESFATPSETARRSAVRKPIPHTSSASAYGFRETPASERLPNRFQMRCPSAAETSCAWRKTMTSRRPPAASLQAFFTASARFAPSPVTSRGGAPAARRARRQAVEAERGDDPLRELVADARHHARPQIALDAVGGARPDLGDGLGLELLAVLPVGDHTAPRTRTRAPTARAGNVPEATASRFDWPSTVSFTTRKAGLRVLVGHPLDLALDDHLVRGTGQRARPRPQAYRPAPEARPPLSTSPSAPPSRSPARAAGPPARSGRGPGGRGTRPRARGRRCPR